MKLWFQDSYGDEREIAQCETLQEVNLAIDKFIADCNSRKPPHSSPFKRYYTRVWKSHDGRTKFDVGSHTEFFLWEGECDF